VPAAATLNPPSAALVYRFAVRHHRSGLITLLATAGIIVCPEAGNGRELEVTTFVALLRAVNVGGTGMLAMKELQSVCAELGLHKVRTYIQSGNVVFEGLAPEWLLVAKLEKALSAKVGKHVSVLIRSASELRAILDANPFPTAKPAQVGVVFLPAPVPSRLLIGLAMPGREELRAIGREIFIHYPDGMGQSKLKLPSEAGNGTTRNLNTVARLAAMAGA
jgi:uncharacterized protein (DUF1697 family)